ncbi:uncharacterized protein [Drosophila bipectinata]|uniref:uncharacterized protein n=1 Tax=Drosophila bipectinata TaxID=42026 RepID=UPI0038B2A2F3
MAEVCITGSLRTTPTDAVDFILDLLPVEIMGAKIATLSAIRLRETGIWKMTDYGHTKLDLHHCTPMGATDYCTVKRHSKPLTDSHPTPGQYMTVADLLTRWKSSMTSTSYECPDIGTTRSEDDLPLQSYCLLTLATLQSAGSVGLHILNIATDENKEILLLLEQCMWSDGGPRPEMNSKSVSNDDQLAIQQLEKNTRRINGRFETGLLWSPKAGTMPIPEIDSGACEGSLRRKLAKEIRRQLDEYVKKGYARPITSEEAGGKPYWYLPIFPVLNVNKPGKLRIVWDAAAKTEGISLNTMLLKGPDQLAQLVPILHSFREKRIAIGGDIAEMFNQVRINTEDQRYHCFVFIDPSTQRRENYAIQVMTFGASCSPSCAQYVKKINAESFKKEYPRAVKCILENHYVDDMLDNVDTEVLSALVRLDETTDGQTEKVLGMWWDTKEDLIRYRVSPRYRHRELLQGRQRPTKREFLSVLMKYGKVDVPGMTPYLRQNGLNGSDGFGTDGEKMTIPRCHMKESLMDSEVEMHTFVDACENGFAAVSYIRFQNEAGIHCSLLGSKTKVAPLRPTSIPRIELMGAVLGARFLHANHETVVNELRQRFWIPKLRSTLARIRRSCQQCKNRQAAPKPPRMAELPYPRVAVFHRAFSYTGVDYFGPLMVRVRRSSEKRYGVLFTCLSTRAIHLEVAYSLTTDSCILAVRSFMARRGCSVELWSDNSTNFQGACTELRRAFEDVDKELLSREFTGPQMTWNFIPPASPHMGGAWERLVRSVKTALESILLDKRPSDELLRAALMEAVAILNWKRTDDGTPTRRSAAQEELDGITTTGGLVLEAMASKIPASDH